VRQICEATIYWVLGQSEFKTRTDDELRPSSSRSQVHAAVAKSEIIMTGQKAEPKREKVKSETSSASEESSKVSSCTAFEKFGDKNWSASLANKSEDEVKEESSSFKLTDLPEDVLFYIFDFMTGDRRQEADDDGHGHGNVIPVIELKIVRILVASMEVVSRKASLLIQKYTRERVLINANFHDLASQKWLGALLWLAKSKCQLGRVELVLGHNDAKLLNYMLEECNTSQLKVVKATSQDITSLTSNSAICTRKGKVLLGTKDLSDLELQQSISVHAPAIEELALTIRIDAIYEMYDPLFGKPSLSSVTLKLFWGCYGLTVERLQPFSTISLALRKSPNLRHLALCSPPNSLSVNGYVCTIYSTSLEELDVSHLSKGLYLRWCDCPSIQSLVPPIGGSLRMPGGPWHGNNSFDDLLEQTLQNQFLSELRHI
jgi:hypothetical protein